MTRKVFKLRNELLEFYEQKNHYFKIDLANIQFASRVAYLSDIFEASNLMSIFLQDPNNIM